MRFEQYLSAVENYLQPLPASVREGEIQEMAGHLQQLHADFVATGHSDEVAQQMALARFAPARKTGLKLRDVWEGNRGALICFVAVAVSNYVLQAVNAVTGTWFMFTVGIDNRALLEPLAPIMALWFLWTLLLMPFGINFSLARWGGRRALLAVPFTYLPILLVPILLPKGFMRAWITINDVKVPFVYLILFFMLLATLAAWLGSNSKRRQRWALIGGASLESASERLHEYQRGHWRRFWRRASTCLAVAGIIGFAAFSVVRKRVDNVLYPPTPEVAVRVMLSDPGMNFGDMEAATEVATRVLPATSEELKKGERRVSYTATMHATETYRKKRIAFMQKNLRRTLAGDSSAYEAKFCRLSLARLKPEGYKISRVVRVKNTAQGWETQDFPESEARAWLYDVYYER